MDRQSFFNGGENYFPPSACHLAATQKIQAIWRGYVTRKYVMPPLIKSYERSLIQDLLVRVADLENIISNMTIQLGEQSRTLEYFSKLCEDNNQTVFPAIIAAQAYQQYPLPPIGAPEE